MSVEKLSDIWPGWEIEKELGRGSYGVVYRAVHNEHGLQSYAAVKVISIPQSKAELDSLRSEGLGDEESKTYLHGVVDDFVNEIRLMQSFKGIQNIVSVEDFSVIEKTDAIGWDIYIRMELLTSFSEHVCDKKLSEDDVIKLGCDICTALEMCEKRNIIHRDVKPENIFVNDFGFFKLGDFGIARKLENMSGGLSQKGTPFYMAPEVFFGNKYDTTVDTYSLGLVMYKLLNQNRLPFLDSDKQLLNPNERVKALERRKAGEPLPPPCEASKALTQVILKACAYNPSNRYRSASEFKKALESVKNGVPILPPIPPVPPAPQPVPPVSTKKKSHTGVAVLIACLITLSILIGGGVLGWKYIQKTLDKKDADEETADTSKITVGSSADAVEDKAPTTKFVEAVATAAAPVATTTAHVATTAAPVVTAAAPVVTTAAPVVTTAAPVVTTAAPVVTTAAPVVTTAAPVVTTTAPTDEEPNGDFEISVAFGKKATIIKYTGSDTAVRIPSQINGNTVTAIGEEVFADNKDITEITIPDSVTVIGNYVFRNCSSLETVNLSDSVTSIGLAAFSGCTSLTEIDLPSNITAIAGNTFYECENLKKITIPAGVTSIGSSAFHNCTNLSEISIPEGVTKIDSFAFENCGSLTKITLPSSVTSISSYAFEDCSGIVEINIPDGIASINKNVFKGCSGIVEISLPDSIKSIDENAFAECSSLAKITIPEGVTSIGGSAFKGCSSLSTIDLPSSITSIGSYAFNSCSNLKEIVIPDGVTSVSSSLFYSCTNLTDVTIPDSVTSIGLWAFFGCENLTIHCSENSYAAEYAAQNSIKTEYN